MEPPPANLTIACQAPALLASDANMGDLLLADIELAGLYAECRKRHAGLAEWARGVSAAKK